MLTEHEIIWTDTLGSYLADSNEDTQVESFFKETAAISLMDHLGSGPVKWLDVGAGPLTKTLRVARELHGVFCRSVITLVTIEPDCPPHKQTALGLQEHVGHIEFYGGTLEAFVSERPNYQANLVTAFHFLYGEESVRALETLLQPGFLARRTALTLVCESPRSDFHLLRAKLRSAGVPAVRSYLEEYVRLLPGTGFELQRHEIAGQYCSFRRTDILQDDKHWLFPFLLGCSPKALLENTRLHAITCSVVRAYVSALPDDKLMVPDVAAIATRLG